MKLELTPVVRYWELHAKEIYPALSELQKRGAKSVAAWIPWSHLETDRHHLLQKFVKQALALNLQISLGITPEIGIGYPNGGIPDDLLRDRQNFSQDRTGQVIYACAPPNIHPIVSLLAPPVFQRYGHFLLKLTQELAEIFAEGVTGNVQLVVTDSFFKHYHNSGLAKEDHGDYSMRHVQFSGTFKKEEWTPMLAEKLFNSRAVDFLRSRFQKNRHVQVVSKKLFSRDASLERLLEEMSGSGINLSQYFQKMISGRATSDFTWLDDLSALSDRERNFLISASLIFYGQTWITSNDYLECSPNFRAKVERLAQTFSPGEAKQVRSAIALVENRFAPARISCLLRDKLGSALKMKSSIFEIEKQDLEETKLLAVEEGLHLEYSQSSELVKIAKERECTVVLFRSSLCERAVREIQSHRSFRLNHGWAFDVALFQGGGHVIVVDGNPQGSSEIEMEKLGESLLSVAKIDPWCHYDRGAAKIFSTSIDWTTSNGAMKTLFLLNPTREAQPLCLHFKNEVSIHGLERKKGEDVGIGKDFETVLPALSVIPLTVFFDNEEALSRDEPSAVEKGSAHAGTQAELA